MQSRNVSESGRHLAVRRRLMGAALALGAAVLPSCNSDATGPAVLLQINGTATINGAPAQGVRVILQDRRGSYDHGVSLGSAVAGTDGRYRIDALAQRSGKVPGCEYLRLFVEGYEYFTTQSAAINCVTSPQTIDLDAF